MDLGRKLRKLRFIEWFWFSIWGLGVHFLIFYHFFYLFSYFVCDLWSWVMGLYELIYWLMLISLSLIKYLKYDSMWEFYSWLNKKLPGSGFWVHLMNNSNCLKYWNSKLLLVFPPVYFIKIQHILYHIICVHLDIYFIVIGKATGP